MVAPDFQSELPTWASVIILFPKGDVRIMTKMSVHLYISSDGNHPSGDAIHFPWGEASLMIYHLTHRATDAQVMKADSTGRSGLT